MWWRRICLAVLTAVVFRVVKRKAKGLGEAQAKLLWTVLLAMLATPAASAKARSTEDRIPGIISALGVASTAAAAINPITSISGKAAFLAGISEQAAPVKAGSNPTPTSGNASFSTFAGAETYCDELAANVNDLLAYVNELASCVNGIYDALQSANIFT